jgi:hypothetical protein
MEEPNTNNKISGPSEAQINCYLQIVKGQTDMSEEDILVSLKEHNYDIVKVVRAYIKSGKTTQPAEVDSVNNHTSQSVNQMRFNEIRHFMDKAAESFRRNQEMNRIYQQVMEKKKAHAAAAAADSANSHEMTNSKL